MSKVGKEFAALLRCSPGTDPHGEVPRQIDIVDQNRALSLHQLKQQMPALLGVAWSGTIEYDVM